jgi:hypothetical protein
VGCWTAADDGNLRGQLFQSHGAVARKLGEPGGQGEGSCRGSA